MKKGNIMYVHSCNYIATAVLYSAASYCSSQNVMVKTTINKSDTSKERITCKL